MVTRMLSEADDAVRLSNTVALRRQRTVESMGQIRSIIQASERAIEESRKLLALNEAVLAALRPAERAPDPRTNSPLDELPVLTTKTRDSQAFVWNANAPLPIVTSTQSTAIQ